MRRIEMPGRVRSVSDVSQPIQHVLFVQLADACGRLYLGLLNHVDADTAATCPG